MTIIYTDGAARGNPGPGGWAAIILEEDKVREIGGRDEHTTNNKMELTGAIKALESASEGDITVHTDSEYVMKGITEWIHNWQAKGWRTAARKPVLNQDLWQKLLEVTEGRNISWKYVAGHSGDKHNDRVDEIATSFADSEDPHLYNGPRSKYK
jgi:ribonuclease HI